MKKNLVALSFFAAVGTLSFALTSCGGTTTGQTSGNTSNSSGDTTSIDTIDKKDDVNFDTSKLVDDREYDDEGNVIFDDVQLSMWSIIGSPDDVVFKKLVQNFNNEYRGQISLNVVYQGHFDYYTALDNTWANDFESVPDVCFMHNEKTREYQNKGYLYPLDYSSNGKDTILSTVKDLDTTQIYENIARVTKVEDTRFAVSVDAHGFLTSIRQDIIKKNGLGFDGNTRFIPSTRAELNTLLQGLRDKADAGTLQTRDVRLGEDHTWKIANKDTFYPEYMQSTDPDGLSALYANDGDLTLNKAGVTIDYHNNDGFKAYLTDQVDRYNNRLMGDPGTNVESFGVGNIVMFSEGPWWIGQTYDYAWNNAEMSTEGNGVSAADAADPVYSKPLAPTNSAGWWTLDSHADSEYANKWYGNGHAVSLTRHCTSMTKAAAAMEFIKWYCQGTDSKGNYNLATWATGGHMPAWKNVYDSDDYQNEKASNITLKALGDPANIMAMESLAYETTIFTGIGQICSNVQSQLKSGEGCTTQKALQLLMDNANSTQSALDLLIGF